MTHMKDGWQIVFQHKIFHVLLNVYESDGTETVEEGQERHPFYYVIALKVWAAYMVNKKELPTGKLLILDIGGSDSKEEVKEYAQKIWIDREKQEWYPEYISSLKEHVRPKYLSLISDFKNVNIAH